MTDYADRKVKDILTKAKGQAKVTEQAVRTLIERDHKFLLSLVEPYLGGIIAHAIDRGRKHSGIKASPASKSAPVAPKAMPKTTARKTAQASAPVSGASMDGLLKAWAAKFDAPEKKPGEPKVSAQHIDAMKALVKKNYKK